MDEMVGMTMFNDGQPALQFFGSNPAMVLELHQKVLAHMAMTGDLEAIWAMPGVRKVSSAPEKDVDE